MLIKGLKGKFAFNSAKIYKTSVTSPKALNFSTNKVIFYNEENGTKNNCQQVFESYVIPNSGAKTDSREKQDFENDLLKWAIQNKISFIAFSRLLKVLGENGIKDLPKSSQTLLKAKENEIVVSSIPPGTYIHFGLTKSLTTLMVNLLDKNLFNETDINLSIFIDQLSLVKLSEKILWVILGSIAGFINNIFFIGLYTGHSKPYSSNLFLSEFVKEAKELCSKGLMINKIHYSVNIKRLICDSHAKAFLLNIKDSTGYSSCTKCNTVGKYNNNKICFLEKSYLRKDEDFEKNEIYLDTKTNLLEIPNFGIVSNVTLDYMHLVCLGVMHKLLSKWVNNMKYWNSEDSASVLIKHLAPLYPCECSKNPLSFDALIYSHPNKFREFLLYYGPVILKNNLKQKFYDHFLLLHIACRLLCLNADEKNVDLGRTLFNNFVENYKSLYEGEQITHNFHGLYHLADECASHGTLDSFSAFPFESFILKLKNSLKKTRKRMLLSVVLKESCNNAFSRSINRLTSRECRVVKKSNIDSGQFQNYSHFEKLSLKNFNIIPRRKGDKYVSLKNGKIIEVTSVLKKKNYFVAGKEFSLTSNFHSDPFDSLKLKMFKVQNLSDTVELWPVNMIDTKLMKIPVGDEESVMVGLLEHNF